MKFFLKLLYFIFFVILITSPIIAQDTLRARIGMQIKHGDVMRKAESKNTVTANDILRIYVVPEVDAYVYVIYSDQKTTMLLNNDQIIIKKGSSLILPPDDVLYKLDGASKKDLFTIICSSVKLKEIDKLNSGSLSYARWAEIEDGLIKKSEIDLFEISEKPIPMAGTIRGTDLFIDELLTYSGQSLLVKRYEFKVKK